MQGQAGHGLPAQTQHRIEVAERQCTRIIAVGQVAVVGTQLDLARAQAGGERQCAVRPAQWHLQLCKAIAGAGTVGLVAAQLAADAQHPRRARAAEVLETPALILLCLDGQAGHQIGIAEAPAKPDFSAAVATVEVDHAAALAGRRLRRERYRLPLGDTARALVEHQLAIAQCAAVGEAVAPAQTRLALTQGFAGVVLAGLRRCLCRISIQLGTAQAQRVLGPLLVV